MTDITNPRLLYAKGLMFLLLGVISALLVVAEHPTLKVAALLAVAVWSFARAYYFAFYVIEHYVDRSYRFAGLCSFLAYVWQKRAPARQSPARSKPAGDGNP